MYIDNERFLAELKLSQKEPTEQLCMYFLLIIRDFVYRKNASYVNKEDLIQEILLKCLEKYKKYNLNHKDCVGFWKLVIGRDIIKKVTRDRQIQKERMFFRYSVGEIDGDWMTEQDKNDYNDKFIHKWKKKK